MYSLKVRNINAALYELKKLLAAHGIENDSRNGPVIELNEPVGIEITNPKERCLFWTKRRWNPFFAFHEAMWIMAGRQDLEWLLRYNKEMSRWSDDGEIFNAPYGYRMRNHDMENLFATKDYTYKGDQVKELINLLKIDPNTRQAVIQIWDYRFDGPFKKTLDRACNMLVIFSLRNKILRMSVINRSNDLLLGFCNVNHVQFSILHEYVASNVGATVGPYTHFSNCMHVYTEDPRFDKLIEFQLNDKYCVKDFKITPLVRKRIAWDNELSLFMQDEGNRIYSEPWFHNVMGPLNRSWWAHKNRDYDEAKKHAEYISSKDIRFAALDWLVEIERIWRNKI